MIPVEPELYVDQCNGQPGRRLGVVMHHPVLSWQCCGKVFIGGMHTSGYIALVPSVSLLP